MILYQPMQIRDGKWSQIPMWHRKAVKNGELFVTGYDPEGLIDVGYEITDDAGYDADKKQYIGAVYTVTEVLERRDHKGKPAGNNAFYKVRCKANG